MANGNHISDRVSTRYGCATDTGRVRQENEDSFFISKELNLFGVSDGMGGHAGGKLASRLVVERLPKILKEEFIKLKSKGARPIKNIIRKSIIELNHIIRREGTEGQGHKNMGATVVLALALDRRIYIANVGDSRAYRLRNNRLKQLTVDHTVVAELVESGQIKEEQSENHPAQGIITQCIGFDDQAKPSLKSFVPNPGDRLLLCSDGLTDVMPDNQIRKILQENYEPQKACDSLIKAANQAGAPDNITAMVINFK
ncbi:MAG: Stp1/IreP family PP2C-type Ser/Thr phosphatase [Sedimentisphaerales bacterium]|nr:Stp1/IreP family PP2C-type Ser/Thr phosphatase [Sedimentisphaerales bacterium]